MKNINLFFLTGISGSGKSTALRALEDIGYFCVDNLPASLVMPFAEDILKKHKEGVFSESKNQPKYALLVDCREETPFASIESATKMLRDASLDVALIFIDCTDEVASIRFRETRRKHPLISENSESSSITNALIKERELLKDFRSAANKVIDTSKMSVHDLRKCIEDLCEERRTTLVTFQSFGYKYGNPIDVDLMFDIRFLKNPYFEKSLRNQTGLSLPVRDYVLRQPDTLQFLDKIEDLFNFLFPRYENEGKQYLNIGIGCTGGKHRSVAVSEELHSRFKKQGFHVQVLHRDIEYS